MIRSKKEWRCIKCDAKQLKWEGRCRACGVVDSLEEIILAPPRAKATPLQRQRAPADPNRQIRRRAKDSERSIAKRMVAADGADPAYANIASSTGRVGHITNMRFDAVSKHYITENKNRKIPSWMITAWIVLNQRGVDFSKNILLHVDPPNMPKDIQINGGKVKLDTLAIITQTRHEELIQRERMLSEILTEINNFPQYANLQSLYSAIEQRDRLKKQI